MGVAGVQWTQARAPAEALQEARSIPTSAQWVARLRHLRGTWMEPRGTWKGTCRGT